jgi:hypothetical protein
MAIRCRGRGRHAVRCCLHSRLLLDSSDSGVNDYCTTLISLLRRRGGDHIEAEMEMKMEAASCEWGNPMGLELSMWLAIWLAWADCGVQHAGLIPPPLEIIVRHSTKRSGPSPSCQIHG